MIPAMQTLLDRMDTHPDEFVHTNRWLPIFKKFESCLTEEEKQGWAKKIQELHRKEFNDAVMRELLTDEGESNLKIPSGTTAQRPISPVIGMQRYNQNSMQLEMYDGKQWIPLGTAVAGGGGGGAGYTTNTIVGGGGGGGSGSVIVKTPTGTHTFTKSGTFTGTGDEYNNP